MSVNWRTSLLTVFAAVLYSWGLSRGETHEYYSAAVTSMSQSWSNFFFGALDPSGAFTTDKLPGSLWVHALPVRLFGMHQWSLLLPEALAATASVPLLMGAVRRLSGQRASVLTGLAMLTMPVTFAAAQVNMPDTLLLASLAAAAYALVRALEDGRRWLLLCAVALAAGFQFKMLQAWVVVPAFGLTYLFCANASVRSRWWNTALFGAMTTLLSLSWMIVISLVPAGSRPRIDGSPANSVWQMVFGYNGIGRGGQDGMTAILRQFGGAPGVGRLFNEQIAAQIAWLLPLAAGVLIAGLVTGRRRPRQQWSGLLLWGLWLVLAWAAFSALTGVKPYYTTMLVPAVAALTGTGLDQAYSAWRARQPAGWLLPAGLVLTAGWAVVVLARHPGLVWLPPVIAIAAAVAVGLLLFQRFGPAGQTRPVAAGVAVTGLLAVFGAPAAWLLSTPAIPDNSAWTVSPVAGPVEFQGRALNRTASGLNEDLHAYLRTNHRGERFLLATGQASSAAPFVLAGANVLPLHGFSNSSPSVPVTDVARLVAAAELRYVLRIDLPNPTDDARALSTWLREHCDTVDRAAYGATGQPDQWDPTLYDCAPH